MKIGTLKLAIVLVLFSLYADRVDVQGASRFGQTSGALLGESFSSAKVSLEQPASTSLLEVGAGDAETSFSELLYSGKLLLLGSSLNLASLAIRWLKKRSSNRTD